MIQTRSLAMLRLAMSDEGRSAIAPLLAEAQSNLSLATLTEAEADAGSGP